MTSVGSFLIDRRFRGPERSGNGGYTAGRLAALMPGLGVEGAVTVTLRQPPPLSVALLATGTGTGTGEVELRHGDTLIATASAGGFVSPVADPVSFDDATAARASYRGLTRHPFPGCFACGTEREPGDGLRLAPGLVGEGRTACVWVPDPSLASGPDAGLAGVEFVWSALDCPGGWTSDIENRPMVLGRMTAEVIAAPAIGAPVVVVGALLGQDGRKTYTSSAMYDGDRLLARAEHTWIAVDPALFT